MPRFTKRSDVMAEATRRAEELRKQEPEEYGDKSLATVRGHVMAADASLREALAALPPEEEPAVVEVPIDKGADVLREVEADAERLMTDPRVLEVPGGRGRMAKARLLAWERSGRRDRYQQALRS